MLVLTRRISESIYIGDNKEIKLTVLGIFGNQVRIGFDAPKIMPIIREELVEGYLNKEGVGS